MTTDKVDDRAFVKVKKNIQDILDDADRLVKRATVHLVDAEEKFDIVLSATLKKETKFVIGGEDKNPNESLAHDIGRDFMFAGWATVRTASSLLDEQRKISAAFLKAFPDRKDDFKKWLGMGDESKDSKLVISYNRLADRCEEVNVKGAESAKRLSDAMGPRAPNEPDPETDPNYN